MAEREPLAADPADVVREVRIAARPEVVFDYFVDPDKVVRWMAEVAEIEPQVGGIYRLTIQGVTSGEVVELEPPRRLAFTWGWEGDRLVPPGSSTVVVDLEPDGDGTLVRLTHRGLPAEARELHREGWDRFLPLLAAAASEQGGQGKEEP